MPDDRSAGSVGADGDEVAATGASDAATGAVDWVGTLRPPLPPVSWVTAGTAAGRAGGVFADARVIGLPERPMSAPAAGAEAVATVGVTRVGRGIGGAASGARVLGRAGASRTGPVGSAWWARRPAKAGRVRRTRSRPRRGWLPRRGARWPGSTPGRSLQASRLMGETAANCGGGAHGDGPSSGDARPGSRGGRLWLRSGYDRLRDEVRVLEVTSGRSKGKQKNPGK